LVNLGSPEPVVSAADTPCAYRPRANFLAQLIANRQKAPQTRIRRRAEPSEAVTAYAAADRPVTQCGALLSRAL
jgi:hypothetical protein